MTHFENLIWEAWKPESNALGMKIHVATVVARLPRLADGEGKPAFILQYRFSEIKHLDGRGVNIHLNIFLAPLAFVFDGGCMRACISQF